MAVLQAVPDEEPVPHAALPPPGAAAALGLRGVLPTPLHRDPLLYLLLPGGRRVHSSRALFTCTHTRALHTVMVISFVFSLVLSLLLFSFPLMLHLSSRLLTS